MSKEQVLSTDILKGYPEPDLEIINGKLAEELKDFNRKVVVLDDDPTELRRFTVFPYSPTGLWTAFGKVLPKKTPCSTF